MKWEFVTLDQLGDVSRGKSKHRPRNDPALFGGIYLAIIAILPMLLRFTSLNITFGGTAVLIVVGVALETIQQLESQLVMRHYKGFL